MHCSSQDYSLKTPIHSSNFHKKKILEFGIVFRRRTQCGPHGTTWMHKKRSYSSGKMNSGSAKRNFNPIFHIISLASTYDSGLCDLFMLACLWMYLRGFFSYRCIHVSFLRERKVLYIKFISWLCTHMNLGFNI